MAIKVFLLMILFHASLARSLELEIAQSYEKNLSRNDSKIINITREIWNKTISEANSSLILDNVEIQTAQIQILGLETRYTILAKILAHFDFEDNPKFDRFCFIIIHSSHISKEKALMKCFREFRNPIFRDVKVLKTSEEEGIKIMYDYYNKTIQYEDSIN
ncbi:uncharacterized protein LOC141532813 [Cotesia typhae]|uniref:uncharacterized protein LOC141532813 n=1 Tax=Cotesia typhae TaxID=2053667 RepID=UPI003D698781